MPPPQAALFKFSQRAFHGAWIKLPGTGPAAETVVSFHDPAYLPGIIIPIGGRMKMAAGLQYAPQFFNKRSLNQAPFLMALFGPGVGEKQGNPAHTSGGQKRQDLHCIPPVYTDIGNSHFPYTQQ